jgi:opacity protein-like surface antigen
MKKFLIAACAALLSTAAIAADLPVQAINKALAGGYPTRCGYYYGVGTGGSAGAVQGAVVGTQIVQGEIDALVGYTCPFSGSAFWFVEGSFGMNNVNGSVNGLALSGPVILQQRVGVGSPANALFNPFGSSLSLPSLPALPAGVVASNANPYLFAGIVEQDIAAQLGFDAHSHQWLIAPEVGIGMLTRLSNGVVVDTWAGWQMNSQSFCPGITGACAKLGNTGRVGVAFKY